LTKSEIGAIDIPTGEIDFPARAAARRELEAEADFFI
jgi:hypothetical protein